MPIAASTYTFGDGLLTALEFAFLFLWIWIAVGVVFDIFRSRDLSNSAKALWVLLIFVFPLIGVLGYLMVRSLAWLKPWRPHSYRFREEQQLIERWLRLVRDSANRDAGLALEVAECARLVKGYGETHRRGKGNFLALLDALVENPPTSDPRTQAEAIRKAREAALADPEGQALEKQLGKPVIWLKPVPRT